MWHELFMQRALALAAMLGPLCGLLGVFVTGRRMAFFSDTIAHGALTGIGLGLWLGMADPTPVMMGFSVLVAWAMLWLKERTALLTDTIMALLLSGSLAFGLILLGLQRRFSGDLHRFLFGDIVLTDGTDLILAGLLLLAVGAWVLRCLGELTLLTTQEDLAHVRGVNVAGLNRVFVVLLALTVGATIRVLGILLVTALLVIPPAAARNWSQTLRQQLLGSVGLGMAGAVGGVMASYGLDLPCGPSIVLVLVGLFAVSLVFGGRQGAGRGGAG